MVSLSELRKAFRRQVDTYRTGDYAAYLNGYAPDATFFLGRSQMNLEQMRAFMKSSFDGGGKVLDLKITDPENVRFSEAGDAATYHLSWRETFHHPDGHETEAEYHETDVWFRRGGAWKLVHIHLTTISERETKPVKHR